MKCPNCGSENAAEAAFCLYCGTRLVTDAQSPPEVSGKSKAIVMTVIFACVSLVVICGALVAGILLSDIDEQYEDTVQTDDEDRTATYSVKELSGGKYTDEKYGYRLTTKDNFTYTVYLANKELGEIFLPSEPNCVESNRSGSHTLVTSQDAAYLISPSGIDELPMKDAIAVAVSDDGTKLCCVSSRGELSVYDTKTGISKMLDNNVYCGSLALSPDSGTLLYHKPNGFKFDLYCVKNGTASLIAKETLGLSVSDNGELIYAVDALGGLLALRSDNTAERIGDVPETFQAHFFNDARTEFIYASDSGVYVSQGGSAVKYVFESRGSVREIVPRFTDGTLDSLVGRIFANGNDDDCTYYYLDSDLNTYKLCTSLDIGQSVSPDAKSFYYISGGALIRISLGDTVTKETLVSSGVASAYPSPDGCVWYLTDVDELRCIDGNTDKKVSANVYSFEVDRNGTVFYETWLDDGRSGELFRVKSGGDPTKTADRVDDYGCEADHSYIIKDIDTDSYLADIYISTDGASFELCCEDVYHVLLK